MIYDRYVYPGTNVLRNRFDIRDAGQLEVVEKGLTAARIGELCEVGVTGRFDADHLRSIHRYVFRDVYDWAGEFREIEMWKGGSGFAVPEDIAGVLGLAYGRIVSMGRLDGLPQRDVVDCLALTFADLNHAHPFRDGNGRTQRLFLRQLAMACGYELGFGSVSENSMRNLSVAAGRGDLRLLRLTLQEGLRDISMMSKDEYRRQVLDRMERT